MPSINNNSLLVKCHGCCHILEIVNDNDFDSEPLFYVTVWSQYPNSISFIDRLEAIWKLIRGKNLDGGDVIITQSDAADVINFLTKKLAENKSKTISGHDFEFTSTPCPPLEVKPPTKIECECDHDFRRGDGGACKKCGYTVAELYNL